MKKALFPHLAATIFSLFLSITICFSASEAADKVRISVSSLDTAFLTAAGTGH